MADLVAPLPALDVRQVEDPQRPDHGFMLIAVAHSAAAPHAVRVNEGLRFPRRNGATTTYLSEPEVAAAYQNRFAALANRFDSLVRYEQQLAGRLDSDEQAFVVVTLVPDVAGEFRVDTDTLRGFESATVGREPLILPLGLYWKRATVGSRRLMADGSSGGGAPRPGEPGWSGIDRPTIR
ncbi:hypothetical protein [Actinomadura sp. 6N118]|uniref:hypothetical protein n=1 Tax=Actinomadura sp. 6N118 TaxID=3375151 RepID=UPI0037A8D97C